MTHAPIPLLLKLACGLTLVSLALISFAVLDPAPLAVIAAMSIAQGIGTLGFVLFMVVVVRDLRTRLRETPPSVAVAQEPPSHTEEPKPSVSEP